MIFGGNEDVVKPKKEYEEPQSPARPIVKYFGLPDSYDVDRMMIERHLRNFGDGGIRTL